LLHFALLRCENRIASKQGITGAMREDKGRKMVYTFLKPYTTGYLYRNREVVKCSKKTCSFKNTLETYLYNISVNKCKNISRWSRRPVNIP
jgi:hypothetical protein